jgi:hypothetical protein
MTVGFQSWGANNNFIQIDSSYRQLRKTASGRALTNQFWGNGFIGNTVQGVYSYVDVTVYGDYPMMAIRCATITAVMTKLIAAGTWIYRIIASGGANTPIDYWIFNEKLPAPSNVGIQIFNSQGQVVFDGNDSPARIMAYHQTGPQGAGGANYSETLLQDFGRGNWATVQTTFSTNTTYENLGSRRALLQSCGIITRGNQLFQARSISAIYDPGTGWGSMGSSSFYQMGYVTIDLDNI